MEERQPKKITKSSSLSHTEMKEFLKGRDEHNISRQPSDMKLIKLQQTANLPSNIQVHIRVRPLLPNESKRNKNKSIIVHNEKKLTCGIEREFNFELVYDENTTQSFIFDNSIKQNIEKAMQGYNFCVFAYGQTGSGKTFTMGTNFSKEPLASKELGVVPRSITFLFDKIKETYNEYDFTTKISYIELYNEEIRDLINVSMPSKAILLQEDNSGNIKVSGVTECNIVNTEDALSLLWTGNQNRKNAFTNSNDFSSRSHSIYTIFIEKINKVSKEKYNFKISFVDLAGSERLKKTGATGDRFKEGVSINSGLLALSKVIMALTDKDKKNFPSTHIPYRDSKLTRLLKDSLSGNSITVMIGCISPSEMNLDETVHTLNYSSFARSVKIQPLLNVEVNDSDILKEEIKRLKEELDYFKTKSFELPDDKSLGGNNMLSLRINKVEIGDNFMDNSVNADQNIQIEDNNMIKEYLMMKKENDDLKSQNEHLKNELDKRFTKDCDYINKNQKGLENDFDEDKLFALELNNIDLKDETLLLDENFNLKGLKSLKKPSVFEIIDANNLEFSLKKQENLKKAEENIVKNTQTECLLEDNLKTIEVTKKKKFTKEIVKPNSKNNKKTLKTDSEKNKHHLNNTSNDETKYGKKKIKNFLLNNTGNDNIESTRTNNENSSHTNSNYDLQFKFDFETFKPCCLVSSRSIANETVQINGINNMVDFLKNLEDEIYNKIEVENNLSNLSKEKSTFLNLIQNHNNKIEEKIFSLMKIKSNYQNLLLKNDDNTIKYFKIIKKRKDYI